MSCTVPVWLGPTADYACLVGYVALAKQQDTWLLCRLVMGYGGWQQLSMLQLMSPVSSATFAVVDCAQQSNLANVEKHINKIK